MFCGVDLANKGSPLPVSIPLVCPLCGRKLKHANAVDDCGLYLVLCPDSLCRWCDIFEV